jgi:hypothetical protein
MHLMSRLDDEPKSGAIWYANFRQSPYGYRLAQMQLAVPKDRSIAPRSDGDKQEK